MSQLLKTPFGLAQNEEKRRKLSMMHFIRSVWAQWHSLRACMDKLHWTVQGFADAWNNWEKDISKFLSCIYMGWLILTNWLMSTRALIISSYIIIITSSGFSVLTVCQNCALHFLTLVSFIVHASDLRGMIY